MVCSIDGKDDLEFFGDEKLAWKNYTSFDEIMPNRGRTKFLGLGDHDIVQDELRSLKNKLKKRDLQTKGIVDDEGYFECLKVLSKDKELAVVFPLENCIAIQFSSLDPKNQALEYITNEYMHECKSKFVGEIGHIEEKFKIKSANIHVTSRTGIIKDGGSWEPESFWKFFKNDECVGKSLTRFHASEMCDCAPTIVMFEIFPKYRRTGLGSKIVYGIERYMWERGFPKLRLEETKAAPFWRKLGYDIDIDEGKKDLSYLCSEGDCSDESTPS